MYAATREEAAGPPVSFLFRSVRRGSQAVAAPIPAHPTWGNANAAFPPLPHTLFPSSISLGEAAGALGGEFPHALELRALRQRVGRNPLQCLTAV